MTVLRGDEVLFLDMVDCDRQVKAASLVGKRFPFFTNASGKAIKALEAREMSRRPGKKRAAGGMDLNLAELEAELSAIREKGVAVDSEGLGEGVISVAVAVRDYAGKVIGALTMLGPSFRMVTSRLESEIIPSLTEGAEILSMKFGYARA
jgi:DNA-binding IclR family transcriptional regulator